MEPNKAAASIDKRFAQRYRNVPKQLLQTIKADSDKDDKALEEKRKAIVENAKKRASAMQLETLNIKEENYEFLQFKD